ncbi:MAG: RsmB/NOP family class I SAM-dependent RNA methyltransferase [Candidatus Parvarchaeota archaeon]|nr:RsmB/NOP family class I SAM-dependent RNA methyltransferase [Candidatus Haiyanarchaeum thermophilum]MCW1306357.1 RsmB/NOP family class I SAM-dependent RNA methyltransferase [Candidatus Haiyanarchaeum thermophilum]MCW1307133.1 RsmB/NOP family class I SAM-dependent RNA methyltransferase [Candidatus Haiyanarchaeum thermophilum]MCW1307804.1 RsmB/NOP family class I SAM-dependent RNA methyltransferase [Candidatus Haiyanarchaeum thermophilum]
MELVLKDEFLNRIRLLMGEEMDVFIEYCRKPLPTTIRVNTIKISKNELLRKLGARYTLEPIPWYADAFIVRDGFSLGNTLEHVLGYFYIQEAASMIPPLILAPKENEWVLDLCAAPGSKATQIAQLMRNTGLLIANDVRIDRIKPLVANLQRCGVTNCIVTMMDGNLFREVRLSFDKVLVDAPCSSEGAIRKDFKIAKMWNPKMILKLSRLQKKLIATGFMRLKEGGRLVYSTCTLAPEENEEVVDFLLKKYENAEIEKIGLKGLKFREGIVEWKGKRYDDEVRHCMRIYPQDNDTEGFFVASIIKK